MFILRKGGVVQGLLCYNIVYDVPIILCLHKELNV